jgi:hypothetical protein
VLDDPCGGKRVAFEGEALIDRRQWDLVWNMPVANGGRDRLSAAGPRRGLVGHY